MPKKKTHQNGTIFIVDISGYSKFVKETESSEGVIIISQLIEAIMSANKLGFLVSEIEGDAVLFYRFGTPYPVNDLLNQFEVMLIKFNQKLRDIKSKYCSNNQLSIKGVVHYGEISEYRIFNFKKLYGQILIEAHRLLKNNIHDDTYTLITDQYLNEDANWTLSTNGGFQECGKYDVGKLCYTYFPYTNVGIQSSVF
jgi:hypothetical protein